MTGKVWDESKTERLRELAALGYSSGKIAAELQCTRNAIIGRCRRAKIQLNGNHGYQPQIGIQKKAARLAKEIFKPVILPMMQEQPHKPRLHLRVDENGKPLDGCTLFDLNRKKCRWPMWGNARDEAKDWFCGAPPKQGSAYCLEHHLVSVRAFQPSNKEFKLLDIHPNKRLPA